jgi:hypothetical protein
MPHHRRQWGIATPRPQFPMPYFQRGSGRKRSRAPLTPPIGKRPIMNSNQPRPPFSILMAQLKRHQIDCYKIRNTQYYTCIHRPSSSRCLLHWQNKKWQLTGKAQTPAYRIAQWVLNKLVNQSGRGADPTTTSEELSHITTDTDTLEELAP